MSSFGLTYESIMCYLNLTDLEVVTILEFTKKKIAFSLEFGPPWKEKNPTITPPKQMQTLLFYWL
jgi:hypothetical protein